MSDWKNNRPLDWENGWDKEREEDGMASKYEIFEAGADAILEALKKLPDTERVANFDKSGWLVFIPEESK